MRTNQIADNENIMNIMNIDFITNIIVDFTARLYAKINSKQDTDMKKHEMTMALDSNILPTRYTADVIDCYFKLIGEADNLMNV
jgi:hypothetical protein